MRIAILTPLDPTLFHTGGDIAALRLSMALGKLGHDVHLFVGRSNITQVRTEGELVVHTFREGRLPFVRGFVAGLSVNDAVRQEHEKNPFDVVDSRGGDISLLGLKGLKMPRVLTIVDSLPEEFKSIPRGENRIRAFAQFKASTVLENRALSQAQAVFIWTEAGRRELARAWGSQHPPVHVVPPGLNAEWFCAERRSLSSRLAEPMFLFVGSRNRRLASLFIRALSNIKAGGAKVQGVILRDSRSSLRQLVQQLRAPVVFYENLDEISIRRLYVSSLALVMPSLREAFGIPVIEAAACFTPSIVSNIPQLTELVRNEINGIVVEDFSTKSWEAAMLALLSDRALWMRLSRAGFDCAENFQIDRIATRVGAIYDSLAA